MSSDGPLWDADGDGKETPFEAKLCRLCLAGMLLLAFGSEATTVLL
jgi:hypothetical protein